MIRQPRQHNEAHLAFIRQLPCVICHDDTSTEACHIRYADPSVAKLNPGIGAKPDDKYALPMCGAHHRYQHSCGNESQWWKRYGKDPVKLALALYAVSGDYARGRWIIREAR